MLSNPIPFKEYTSSSSHTSEVRLMLGGRGEKKLKSSQQFELGITSQKKKEF
jgi:hypothetical protein